MSKTQPEVEEAIPLPAVSSDIRETNELVAQIQILARTQCDLIEAAAFLGLMPDEFERYLLANRRSFIAWFSGEAAGRAALKMQQFKAAQSGDSRLLVWLGKNVLGQTDKLPAVPPESPRPGDKAWENLSTWRMQRLG